MHLLCGVPAKGRRAGAKCSTALSGVVLDKKVSDFPITWVWPSNPFEESEGLLLDSRRRCGESRAAATHDLPAARVAREASSSFSLTIREAVSL